MTSLRLPADLAERYERLADDLDGFEEGADLARYVLDATADELRRDATGGGGSGPGADARRDATESATDESRADDAVVEDRLEQLGYLEK